MKWTYQGIKRISLPTEIMFEDNKFILSALLSKGFIVSI